MKVKSGSRIGRMFKRLFNVRSWFDYDRVKGFTQYLGRGIKKMFVPQKTEKSESFAQAVQEFNLSEQDLDIKQHALKRLSVIMVIFAACMLIYSGYHLFYGTFRATLISLVVMMIALVLAFRYHFWYFQIKKRKLGCTFQEWYREGLLGEKNE